MSRPIRALSPALLLLSAVFCFESVAQAGIQYLSERSGMSIDTGFWSMGISAIACYSLSLLLAHRLLLSGLLKGYRNRHYLLPSFAFLVFFLIQLYRRPFALPFWDDYYGYYEWQLQLQTTEGLASAINAFFETYLECKTAVSRFIAEGFRIFTGTGFIHLSKLFNLVILGTIAWVIASAHPTRDRRRNVFWISGILLFNLQQFYNILCAFSGTTYYLVVLFAVLAFRHRQRENTLDLFLTVTFSTAAALTFGNGWIVFPLIVLGYLLERRYRTFTISLIVFAVVAVLYFSDYHPERLNPLDRFEPAQFLLYGLSFLGGHFQFHDFYLLPFLAAGAVLTVLSVGVRRYGSRAVGHLSMNLLVFLTGTAFLAALFRHQNGFQQSLSLRYGFFSVTALAAALSCLLTGLPEKTFIRYSRIFLYGAMILTGLKSLFFYPEMAIAQTENHRMIRNWLLTGTSIEKRTAFYPEGTTGLLQKSEAAGLWKRTPYDTTAVNSTVFTIGYITPGSTQKDPIHSFHGEEELHPE